jgi:hypothetical protein
MTWVAPAATCTCLVGMGWDKVAEAVVVSGARSVPCCASPCVAAVVPVLALTAVHVADPKTTEKLPVTSQSPGVSVTEVMSSGVAVVRLLVAATRTAELMSSPTSPAAGVVAITVGNITWSRAATVSANVVLNVRWKSNTSLGSLAEFNVLDGGEVVMSELTFTEAAVMDRDSWAG